VTKLDYDHSTNKFELYVDFNKKNRDILSKGIGYCRKRTSKGCWSVPDNAWSIEQVYEYFDDIKPTEEADMRLEQYREKMNKLKTDLLPKLHQIKKAPKKAVEKQIDFEFKGKYDLYEHQIKMFWAATRFIEAGCGFAFFSDPGTGKSAPAVNVIEYFLEQDPDVKKVLVVTPASIKYNFQEQFEEHSSIGANVLVDYDYDRRKGREGRRFRWTDPNIPIAEYYDGCTEYLDRETNSSIQVVNYKCIAKERKRFEDYDMIVADEMHYLRGRSSQRSKEFAKLRKKIPKMLGMTATPVCRDGFDLFKQINILDSDLLPNRFATYRDKVANCVPIKVNEYTTIQKPVSWPGMEWVNDKIYSRAIRYEMDECLDLPPKVYKKVNVEMPKKLKKFYNELVDTQVLEFGEMGDDDYAFVDAANSLVVVSYERQLSAGFIKVSEPEDPNPEYVTISGFKVKALQEQLEEIDNKEIDGSSRGEQVVIWYKHKHLLKEIKNMLDEEMEGKSYRVINGEVSNLAKADASNKFMDGKVDYLIASVDVTEGYQAHAARYAIYLENNFTFDKREQSEGRIRRAGQDRKTIYIDIVANGSLDKRILEAIKDGRSLSERALAQEIFE